MKKTITIICTIILIASLSLFIYDMFNGGNIFRIALEIVTGGIAFTGLIVAFLD